MKLGRMIALLACAVAATAWASPETQFDRANKLYEDKEYDSALVAYGELAASGIRSAPLCFNLGNTYFRKGDLGHAVLWYLRAQRLEPSDPDIAANLDFAQRFTSIQMEGVQLNPVSSLAGSVVKPLPLNAWAWLSSLCFVLLFLTMTLRYGLGFRNGWTKAGTVVLVVLTLSAALLTTIKYDVDYITVRAVIVADEAVVHTGPSDRSPKELDAAPGLVVEILDESGGFYNVLFENMRRGWIKKDLVSVV